MTKPSSDDAVERMLNEIEDLLKNPESGDESERPAARPSNGREASNYDPDATVELEPMSPAAAQGATQAPAATAPASPSPAPSSTTQPATPATTKPAAQPSPASSAVEPEGRPSSPPPAVAPVSPEQPKTASPPSVEQPQAAAPASPGLPTAAAPPPPEEPKAAPPSSAQRPTAPAAPQQPSGEPSATAPPAPAAPVTVNEDTKAAATAAAKAAAPEEPDASPAPPVGTPAAARRTADFDPHGEPGRMGRRLTTRLGQILVDDGLLSVSELREALEKQRQSGERLGAVLVNEGYLDEDRLLSALESQYGIPAAALDDLEIDPGLADLLPRDVAERSLMVPIAVHGATIDVAMVDPTDFVAMAHLRFATGLRPNPFITTINGVRRTIARLYRGAVRPDAVAPPTVDAHAHIKRMILDRDSLLMAADQDPRQFYQAAATIDDFVAEIMRTAKHSKD